MGGSLSEDSAKEILRICVNEDAEALKRYLKAQFDEGRQNLYNFISNIFNWNTNKFRHVEISNN